VFTWRVKTLLSYKINKVIVWDEGAGQRKRYAHTARPVGVPTEVWKKKSHAVRKVALGWVKSMQVKRPVNRPVQPRKRAAGYYRM
jgi:hypothetical protein